MPNEGSSKNDEPDIVITEADLDAVDHFADFFKNPTPTPMASIALVEAKCVKTSRIYYLQFRQTDSNAWIVLGTLDDSLPAPAAGSVSAVKSGLVSGNIDWSALYSGQASCPYCASKSVIQCGTCRRLSCWTGSKSFKCTWCGVTGTISGKIKSLDGSEGKKKR